LEILHQLKKIIKGVRSTSARSPERWTGPWNIHCTAREDQLRIDPVRDTDKLAAAVLIAGDRWSVVCRREMICGAAEGLLYWPGEEEARKRKLGERGGAA